MDQTTQGGSGYPPTPPQHGSPYGPHSGYPVYESGPAWEPPPQRKSRGWIVALVIVGLFVLGTIAACAWMGSFFSGGNSTPVIGGNAIALIHIEGVIAGTSGGLTGGSATPERILSQLQQAEDDDRVKAVLLRVDSPGGTVAASEEIATEVSRLDKPVVVSIGDVGASGAYMVSSQADWIVSAPGSNVGSIGVILEVANLQSLLDKLGVKFAVITAGAYKDIGSPYRSLTATETKMLQGQVDLVYGQFIDIVAQGSRHVQGRSAQARDRYGVGGHAGQELRARRSDRHVQRCRRRRRPASAISAVGRRSSSTARRTTSISSMRCSVSRRS